MLRKLGLLLAAFAFISIAGGHWAVLQTLAWAGMLQDYTRHTGSVLVAVEQTFDGRHPCELCREIATAKAREHKGNPAAPEAKDDLKVKALVADSLLPSLIRAVSAAHPPRAGSDLGPGRTDQPPTPPPRRAAVAV